MMKTVKEIKNIVEEIKRELQQNIVEEIKRELQRGNICIGLIDIMEDCEKYMQKEYMKACREVATKLDIRLSEEDFNKIEIEYQKAKENRMAAFRARHTEAIKGAMKINEN